MMVSVLTKLQSKRRALIRTILRLFSLQPIGISVVSAISSLQTTTAYSFSLVMVLLQNSVILLPLGQVISVLVGRTSRHRLQQVLTSLSLVFHSGLRILVVSLLKSVMLLLRVSSMLLVWKMQTSRIGVNSMLVGIK